MVYNSLHQFRWGCDLVHSRIGDLGLLIADLGLMIDKDSNSQQVIAN